MTIEDAAELQLHQRHVLRLEARPPNIEGEGHIPIRDLVRNSLRMRPDRIIVGEVRGAEALDMLQAMNTGHDGSLSTVHSNSPRDGLHRIETMVMMAGYDLPLRAIRQHIAAALDLLVHIDRMEDGSRRVVAVTEVLRMESDVIQLQDIFEFEIDSVAPDRTITGRPQGRPASAPSSSTSSASVASSSRRACSASAFTPSTSAGAQRREARSADRSRVRGAVRARLPARALGAEPLRRSSPSRRRPASPTRRTSSRSAATRPLTASQVGVTENGGPVIGLAVAPPGGSASGAILLIDASNSMKGAPIKNATAAARAFLARAQGRPPRRDRRLRP